MGLLHRLHMLLHLWPLVTRAGVEVFTRGLLMSLGVFVSAQILGGLVTSVATSAPIGSSAFIHVARVVVQI